MFLWVCVYICVFVCVLVYIFVYLCVCVCVCMPIQVLKHRRLPWSGCLKKTKNNAVILFKQGSLFYCWNNGIKTNTTIKKFLTAVDPDKISSRAEVWGLPIPVIERGGK